MAGFPALFLIAALLAAAPITDAAMREETGRLAAELGTLRHIPPGAGLDRQLITREEARAATEATIMGALGGSELATEERILQRLGLLPAGSDYARLLADAFGASPAGAYDPGARRLYVPDWIPLERQRMGLAHEIAHALADQRFGLRQTLQIAPAGQHRLDGDAERARQALIEGDATCAALELADGRGAFLAGRELPAVAERLRAAAVAAGGKWEPWIRAVSLFTHVDGLLFVARVRARESWAAVDAIWAAPPASTEQILHPEKWDAREAPIRIEAAPLPALATRHDAAGTGVLGELAVRAWLAAAAGPEVAARAAAGWGGDRAVLYAPRAADGGAAVEPALAWLTVWDDAGEAEDFARTAVLALGRCAGQGRAPALDESGGAAIHGATGALFALAWRRDAVALLLGAPDSAEPALAAMLADWRRLPAAAASPRDARRRDRQRR